MRHKKLTLPVVIVLSIMSIFSTANAAVWYVNDNATPGGDGTSWASAFDTIQEAINAANSPWVTCLAPTDQIWVKKGTYLLTSELTSNKYLTIYGGFPESGTPGTADRNPTSNQTIIDGNNSVRCMTISQYCHIDGFVFRNGHSTLNAGAIYLDNVPTYDCFGSDLSINISNCRFENNYAGVHGGAIYDLRSNAIIDNCSFSGNDADNGGAIKQWQTTSTISNCIFDDNQATTSGFGGGAILGDYQVYGTITNCLFTNNASAGFGGALSYHQGYPTITNCTFAGNTAITDGGAIYNNTASPVLKNCILWNNDEEPIANYYSTPGATATYCDIEGGYSGTGNININPQFVSSSDYHLVLGSPCIDTGTNSGAPSNDLDGNSRPKDGDWNGTATTDMGAYEFEFINIDLQIDSMTVEPEYPVTGENTYIHITVHNYGLTDAGSFYVDWYANNASVPTTGTYGQKFQNIGSLAAGATKTINLVYQYNIDGPVSMYAQVDTDEYITETDETNNILGPHNTRVIDGEFIDFFIREESYNATGWFGGDDRPLYTRNVGSGQSITLTHDAKVRYAGFYFTDRFDYQDNPDGYGHLVRLNMHVRNSSGTIIKTASYYPQANFKGGWVMFSLGTDFWMEADTEYIFTCYLYKGEANELSSSIAANATDIWPTSTGYQCLQYGSPADMTTWANWTTSSWDYNFSMQGEYVSKYPGDINDDRAVNIADIAELAGNWLTDDCIMPGWCDNSDIDWNSSVSLQDFGVVADNWNRTWYSYDNLNRNAIVSMYGQMNTNSIDASVGNELSNGSVLVYRTSAGRYGKMIVESYGTDITIGWTTYNPSGTVFTSGSGLIIRGTHSCDLDQGLEDNTYVDFFWNLHTATERYIIPKNNSRFYVLYRAP